VEGGEEVLLLEETLESEFVGEEPGLAVCKGWVEGR
jgi:hypothetical protein